MQLLSNTLLVKMCGVRVCFCAVICAFLFFEAANATTCSNATQVVFMTGNCYAQLTTLGDRAVCNRTSQCGVVFGNVTTNCNSSEPLYDEILEGLDLLCNAPPRCFNATVAIQGDYFCDMARMNLSAASTSLVCTGACRALLDDLVNECGNNATGAGIQTDLNAVCVTSSSISPSPTTVVATSASVTSSSTSPSPTTVVASTSASVDATIDATDNATYQPTPTSPSADCVTAVWTFNNDTDCITAFNTNVTDVSTLCQGMCRTFLNAIISACGDSGFVTQADLNENCGGAGALKGMGVLTILLMAVLAAVAH